MPARDSVCDILLPGLDGEPLHGEPKWEKSVGVCGFQLSTFPRKIYTSLRYLQNRPVVLINTHELLYKS